MTKLFLAAALALGAAIPAQAGILLPNIFAREYCSFRQMGVDVDGATEHAVRESYIEGDPVRVQVNGEWYDADVIKANRTARERCPQYFND